MPSNSCLHFITKIINFDGIKVTDYHFITDREILITLDSKTSESCCPHCHVEGINQKIKLIKRRAYGMTNFENFRQRILLSWAIF